MATQPDPSPMQIRLEIVPEGPYFEDITLAKELGSDFPAYLEKTLQLTAEPEYQGKLGGAEEILLLIAISASQLLGLAGGPLIGAAGNKAAEIVVEKIAERIKQIFHKKGMGKGSKESPVSTTTIKSPQGYEITIQGPSHSEVNISWHSDQKQGENESPVTTITIKVSA